LDSKDRRYLASLDKSLSIFNSVVEWADYISFLAKLLKSLQSNSRGNWLPKIYSLKISKNLANCLSPNLPSGVHMKTIEVYSYIFKMIGLKKLSNQISIWIPGLLPLMSFASISIKPSLIELFDTFIITLNPICLKIMIKPLLLSLLPAIDDESSESFLDVLDLIDTLKKNLNDNSSFWQSLFLIIISNPDKRLGALIWCNKRLPSFNIVSLANATDIQSNLDNKDQLRFNLDSTDIWSNKVLKENALSNLPNEAKACVSPEPGLLIRAFCKALKDDNIFVQRGFFDLLLSKLQLNSNILQLLATPSDLTKLIICASSTVLRKDMSLNRRLWNWLLGPDLLDSSNLPNRHSLPQAFLKLINYFKKYGKSQLVNGLLKLIDIQNNSSEDTHKIITNHDSMPPYKRMIQAYKICLAIMDKWEIGSLIIPEVFIPCISSIQILHHQLNISTNNYSIQSQNNSSNTLNNSNTDNEFNQVLKNASAFFDNIEPINIWSDLFKLIDKNQLLLFKFTTNYFNVDEEEMIVKHLPLNLLLLLFKKIFNNNFITIDQEKDKSIVLGYVYQYNLNNIDDPQSSPIPPADLSLMILNSITILVWKALKKRDDMIYYYCDLLNDVLEKIPKNNNSSNDNKFTWKNDFFIDEVFNLKNLRKSDGFKNNFKISNHLFKSSIDTPLNNDDSLVSLSFVSITFGISKIFNEITKSLSTLKKIELLKVLLRLLWDCLIDPSSKYQVESVKYILSFELSIDPHYIESELSNLFLNADKHDKYDRFRGFSALWTHTANLSNNNFFMDQILSRPFQLVLDELAVKRSSDYLLASYWISSTSKSGSSNRLFKMISIPLAKTSFIMNTKASKSRIYIIDDIDLYCYQVQTIMNVLNVDPPLLISGISNELTVLDRELQIQIINAGFEDNFDLSTYKNLIIAVLLRFLSLELDESTMNRLSSICSFTKAMRTSLALLEMLLNGNEKDFAQIPSILLKISFKYFQKLDNLNYKETSQNSYINYNYNYDYILVSFLRIISSVINNSILINYWAQLLSKSTVYFGESIIQAITPLTECICTKINDFFSLIRNSFDNNYNANDVTIDKEKNSKMTFEIGQSIALLMNALDDVLSYCHIYISSSEAKITSAKTNSNDPGFFGSVMSGVFAVETPMARTAEENKKLIILYCIQETAKVCLDIWSWAEQKTRLQLKNSNDTNYYLNYYPQNDLNFLKSINYHISNLKFRSKKLLEKLYQLQPLEVLQTLMLADRNFSAPLFKILHMLDGGKPQSTVPHIFNLINLKLNPEAVSSKYKISIHLLSSSNLNDKMLSMFLVEYVKSLESDAVEEIWNQSMNFLKDVQNLGSVYANIYPFILQFTCILGEKLNKSKFGEQRKVKREISDTFMKILSGTLSARGPSNQSAILDAMTSEELCKSIQSTLPYISSIVQDYDKFTTTMTSIVLNIVTPALKSKTFPNLPSYLLDLLVELSEAALNVKTWKLTINDVFVDSKFFKMSLIHSLSWKVIIKNWIESDKDKMGEFLSKVEPHNASSTTLFGWNESEINSKILKLKRIVFLLIISAKDTYILNLKEIMSKIEEILTTSNALKEEVFLCLRAIVLRFSDAHLTSYWTLIYTELQKMFQNVLDCSKPEEIEDIDCNALLGACKLLDLLLCLKKEDFNQNDWLFISDSIGTSGYDFDLSNMGLYKRPSLDDYRRIELVTNIDEREDIEKNRKPGLIGVKEIENISLLKPFFDSLSLYNFEKTYGLSVADIESCEQDIYNDLFD
ncbi:Dop1p ASCRUDRAFT_21626, partial [Ascoidea rubescens DSM 1968]